MILQIEIKKQIAQKKKKHRRSPDNITHGYNQISQHRNQYSPCIGRKKIKQQAVLCWTFCHPLACIPFAVVPSALCLVR